MEVRERVDSGETKLLGSPLPVEQIPSVPAGLPFGLGWEKERGRTRARVQEQNRVQILIPREIEEIVILPESHARRHHRFAEHENLALAAQGFTKGTSAGREFLGRVLDPLGVGRFRKKDQWKKNETTKKDPGHHGSVR